MRTIVGAYATAPRPIQSDRQFRDYVDAVFATPGVGGLEVPFYETPSHWGATEYLHASPAASRHVLTLVPALVIGMGERPLLGLASKDEAARKDAVGIVREALGFIEAVNAGPGGSFDGIELHSSPKRADGSADALARSLDEIAGWDWGGVQLTIEHCDTDTGTHAPAKGYLPLDDELAVAQPRGVGMVINWGRSAIETRSASGALAQIQQTGNSLSGVVFSGVAPVDTAYGPAWGDFHVPIAGWAEDGSLAAEAAHSLLTAETLAESVRAALAEPSLRFLGLKVAPPAIASDDERVALLRANLALLQAAEASADA